jgi:hypothetical protein
MILITESLSVTTPSEMTTTLDVRMDYTDSCHIGRCFITFTVKVPRYVCKHGAKEFHSAEMLDFYRDNKVVIHPVMHTITLLCVV